MLVLSNYIKSFGKYNLFDISDLAIDTGISRIKGINGSGKTTFLRCVAGVSGFDGSIAFNEYDIRNDPLEYRKRVSFCMSEPVFPAYLTARELIDFTMKARETASVEVAQVVKVLGMNEFVDRKVGTYSSGMLKKTGLAIAFISRLPELILLDEPFTALDSDTIPEVTNLIHGYREKYGSSFILTSHLKPDMIDVQFDRTYEVKNCSLVTL